MILKMVYFYDAGTFTGLVPTPNLAQVTYQGNATEETIRFEAPFVAFTTQSGVVGFANDEPYSLISISDIAEFDDLYPEENLFKVHGNMYSIFYHGDGRHLANITANLQYVMEQGNITTNTMILDNRVTGLLVTSKYTDVEWYSSSFG